MLNHCSTKCSDERKFGNIIFKYVGEYDNVDLCKKAADSYKSEGYLTRMVKPSTWSEERRLYIRKKNQKIIPKKTSIANKNISKKFNGYGISCKCGYTGSFEDFSKIYDILNTYQCPSCGSCQKPTDNLASRPNKDK